MHNHSTIFSLRMPNQDIEEFEKKIKRLDQRLGSVWKKRS